MALFKCPECSREISDKASACPHCGCPVSSTFYPDTRSTTDETITSPQDPMAFAPPTKKGTHKTGKKKWIIIGATIASIAFFVLLILTHTICINHSYSDATVLEPQTCYYCGKTTGDPKPLTKIVFPKKGIGSLLPIPNSNMGEILYDYSDSFEVYIGNTTIDEYREYVNLCLESGFDIDYYKYDDSFNAYDTNGNCINIYMRDNDIMQIYIYATDNSSEESNNTDTEEATSSLDYTGTEEEYSAPENNNMAATSTYVDNGCFSFHPAAFADYFDNASGKVKGYSFYSKQQYDEDLLFYDENNTVFYAIEDAARDYITVGMYSFSKGEDISVPISEAYSSGASKGINILIEDTSYVSPIVFTTVLAIDPGLSYDEATVVGQSIIDNVGNMNGITKNSIQYVLFKDDGYHYLLVMAV